MSRPVRNLLGHRFGRLTVIEFLGMDRNNGLWKCLCDCGKEHSARASPLACGDVTSCGCRHAEIKAGWKERVTTHGMSRKGSREYHTWNMMKGRCLNLNNQKYAYYGGRGITICKRWRDSFENFYADMGERPKGKTLDRIDNNRGYSPGNCKWSTPKEQAANRRPRYPVKVI